MTQTPAGWYPDPEMVGTQRYWDGSAWTEHRTPQKAERSRQWHAYVALVVGAVLALVAMLVPAGTDPEVQRVLFLGGIVSIGVAIWDFVRT